MKAFLIDPATRTITETTISSWRDIAPALECDLFDVVQIGPNVSVYVDDEGLFKDDQCFFQLIHYPQPLAGKGLVLGFDPETGDSTDCPVTAEQILNSLFWMEPLE